MRYLILTYYRKANGQTDEVMALARNLKRRDILTANVILDFKKLSVEKCSMNGVTVPRDWDKIVRYYYPHYQNTMDRLFKENGWEVVKNEPNEPTTEKPTDPS